MILTCTIYFQSLSGNQLINTPEEIKTTVIELPDQVIFAKAFHLDQQGQFQQALRWYGLIQNSNKTEWVEKAQYNMGTVYLEQARKLWLSKGVWEYDQVNTLLDLSVDSFEKVLAKNPTHQGARYNLEATQYFRPPAKVSEQSNWTGSKSSVKAILPGIPGGGP